MIKVTIYRKKEQIRGFVMEGHAGYAKSGRDIVCAAVSVLAINTVNGIEQFTEDAFELDAPESAQKKGLSKRARENRIAFRFTEEMSHESEVLMQTMVLGLTEIQNQYGNSYLTLSFEEV